MSDTKSSTIIVGGGFAGLIIAASLRKYSIPFTLLEKSDRVGGRLAVGNHYAYSIQSASFLESLFPDHHWNSLRFSPKERRKGAWANVGEMSPEEGIFMKEEGYLLNETMPWTGDAFLGTIGSSMHVRKEVVAVDCEKRLIQCHDGFEVMFEKLYWCAPLKNLSSAAKKPMQFHKNKGKKNAQRFSQVHMELLLSDNVFPLEYFLVLPFRHRDAKLRLLGSQSSHQGKFLFHLFFLVEDSVAEDREEVAKYVRSAKRELQKEFPEIIKSVLSERIVFLDNCPWSQPSVSETLEVFPGVFHVGPELRMGESSASNHDLTLENCQFLERQLSASMPA